MESQFLKFADKVKNQTKQKQNISFLGVLLK